jgi:hypothetical protein
MRKKLVLVKKIMTLNGRSNCTKEHEMQKKSITVEKTRDPLRYFISSINFETKNANNDADSLYHKVIVTSVVRTTSVPPRTVNTYLNISRYLCHWCKNKLFK